MQYLIVDGYLNGTGIRDKITGGYLSHLELDISATLSRKIDIWLKKYWNEFYTQYAHSDIITILDEEGKQLAREFQMGLTDANIEYYSDAKLMYLSK